MKGNLSAALKQIELTDKDYKRDSLLEKKLILIKQENDKRFGVVMHKKDNATGEEYLVKEIVLNSKAEASNYILKTKSKISIEHPHILKLRDYSCGIKSTFCSSQYWIRLIFDYPYSDLEKLVKEKKANKGEFNDEELTHLLYQQVYAGSYLEIMNQNHGNIRQEYIGIFPKLGISKNICDISTFNNSQGNIQIMNYNTNTNLYVSPKMFDYICNNGKSKLKIDKYKEDVFALGLVILELGTKKSVQDIYNRTDKNIRLNKLQEYIEEFQNIFYPNGEGNSLLTTTVEHMLIIDEESRPSFTEIKNKLPEYEEIIQFFMDNNEGRTDYNDDNALMYSNYSEMSKTENHLPNYNNESNFMDTNRFGSNEEIKIEPITNNNKNSNYEKHSFLKNNNIVKSVNKQTNNNNNISNILKNDNSNNVQYYWDDNYKMYYYYEPKTNSYEWYYGDVNKINKNYNNNNLIDNNTKLNYNSKAIPDGYVIYRTANGEEKLVKRSELNL